MTKRYYIRYEDNIRICGSNEHNYCGASTLKTAQAIAKRVKNEIQNARNVRVYDILQDDENGYAKIVFQIA